MKPITFVAAGTLLASALSGAVMAADSRAGGQQTTEGMAQDSSQQPIGDSWITAKVKSELLAARDVSGLDISVETLNGQVRLTGSVESQAQADKAVAVARGVKGVKDVDATGLTLKSSAGR